MYHDDSRFTTTSQHGLSRSVLIVAATWQWLVMVARDTNDNQESPAWWENQPGNPSGWWLIHTTFLVPINPVTPHSQSGYHLSPASRSYWVLMDSSMAVGCLIRTQTNQPVTASMAGSQICNHLKALVIIRLVITINHGDLSNYESNNRFIDIIIITMLIDFYQYSLPIITINHWCNVDWVINHHVD